MWYAISCLYMVKTCISTGQSEHDALPSKRVAHEVGGVGGFPSSLYE